MPASAITLRQLRVLLAVAEHSGFGRAGDDIGLSQPAVSQAVRSLEAELGVKLLDRTTREVVLTVAGQSLVAPLRRVLGELDDVLDEARGLGAAARGIVHVASAPTISGGLMPQVLAAAQQRYPELQVRLSDQAQQLAIEGVRQGAVDFAVLVGMDEDDPLIEQQPLFDERFVLVCPAGHALAGIQEVKLAHLAGWPLVLLDHSSGSRPLIDRACARAGVSLNVAIDVGHPATAFRMVQAGLGVSVMPALSLPLPTDQLQAVPVEAALSRHVVLARRRQRSLSPAAQRLWTLIADLAGAPPTCP
ncbi:LysR family transcriptional regulator [Roseateles sp. BYS96W]|uniref:LysR family transcriptional regulator n=1 Tax=Pelomonas nitida TaxID=3299027 RepID=A0ABW7G844_9BURK